MQRDIIHLVVK